MNDNDSIKHAINNHAGDILNLEERVSTLTRAISEVISAGDSHTHSIGLLNDRISDLSVRLTIEPRDDEEKQIKFLRLRGDTYQSKLLDKQKECDNLALRCEDLTKTLAETEQQSADWQRSFEQEQGNADGWYKTAQTNEAERIKWAQKYDALVNDADHWRIDAKEWEVNSKNWETNYHEMMKCRDEWRVKWNQADNASKEWEEECGEWEDKYDEMKKQAYEWERRFHALSSDMTGTCSENERLHKVINSINSLIQI